MNCAAWSLIDILLVSGCREDNEYFIAEALAKVNSTIKCCTGMDSCEYAGTNIQVDYLLRQKARPWSLVGRLQHINGRITN